jgi:hypothetical protein
MPLKLIVTLSAFAVVGSAAEAGPYRVIWGGNYPGAANTIEIPDKGAKEFKEPLGLGGAYRCSIGAEQEASGSLKVSREWSCQDIKTGVKAALNLSCEYKDAGRTSFNQNNFTSMKLFQPNQEKGKLQIYTQFHFECTSDPRSGIR